MRSRWFFVVPFVLLMLWFLGNIASSPALYNFILGHYEFGLMPNDYPFQGPTAAPGFVTVANGVTEILGRGTLVFGSVTFFSALVSFLLYKALKNLDRLAS